jgi:hypothetical protein
VFVYLIVFVPHRKGTYTPPRPVTEIALLLLFKFESCFLSSLRFPLFVSLFSSDGSYLFLLFLCFTILFFPPCFGSPSINCAPLRRLLDLLLKNFVTFGYIWHYAALSVHFQQSDGHKRGADYTELANDEAETTLIMRARSILVRDSFRTST